MALIRVETKFVVVDSLPAKDSCPLRPGEIGLVDGGSIIGLTCKGIKLEVVIIEDDLTHDSGRCRQVIVRFRGRSDECEHSIPRWKIEPLEEPSPIVGLQAIQGPGLLGILREDVFLPTFTRDEQHTIARALLFKFPGCDLARKGRRYWVFRDRIYSTNENFTSEEMTAVIIDAENRKKARVERALNKVALGPSGTSGKRQPIADDVKMFVWQRDRGCCVKCSSNRNLEFDHIIPLAMGGSNTARNLQLLCEDCNRAKGASLV